MALLHRLGGRPCEAVGRANDSDKVLAALAYPAPFPRDRAYFSNDRTEWRRLFGEVLGTFFLVLVAVGGGMVNSKFGGDAIGQAVLATAPGLMVGAVILSMGSVFGAHLNPGVSLAFAMRGDFPWNRVPGYIVAHFVGACLATLLLVALIGVHGAAGLTLPGPSVSPATAMLWEALLTVGLVTVILGAPRRARRTSDK
jgi:aquaporin Z